MIKISQATFSRVYQQLKKKDHKEQLILEILNCYYFEPEKFDQVEISSHRILLNDGLGVGSLECHSPKQLFEQVYCFLRGRRLELLSSNPSLFQANGRRLPELILGDQAKGGWEEEFKNQSKGLVDNFWIEFRKAYSQTNQSRLAEIRANFSRDFRG